MSATSASPPPKRGERFFLDTNILVYSFDQADKRKSKRADVLIEFALQTGQGFISSQVVQEFLNVALKKFQDHLRPQDMRLTLTDILWPLCRHTPNASFYEQALDLLLTKSLSFYDALIVQAAIDLGCQVIYSEDLQHGQEFNGVRAVNPFY